MRVKPRCSWQDWIIFTRHWNSPWRRLTALPFLDVQVIRQGRGFETTVYHKPTFTGLYARFYARWDSYAPTGQKLALIKSLTMHVKWICSEDDLGNEIRHLKLIFQRNGYPSQFVDRIISQTLNSSVNAQIEPTDRVIIRLPWFGPISMPFKRKLLCLTSTYAPQWIAICCFTSKNMFSTTNKDVLPMTAFSNVIYLSLVHVGTST